MSVIRNIASLAIVLTMAVSTFGVGMARAQMPVAGEMVICTGHGAITVSVDALGNPVERVTLCPETAGTILLSLAIAEPAPQPEHVRFERLERPVFGAAPRLPHPVTHGARAPPV